MHSLSIVIPAYNEEDAIGNTVQLCLEARDTIQSHAPLSDIEIIVVNDGSTDRTAEIAQSFSEVIVVSLKKNQGYGAAIKEGFKRAKGTLLGFLDADGTCQPSNFKDLWAELNRQDADIVLGARLLRQNKMPCIRRLGNTFYAVLLGWLCGKTVTDTASGMRLMTRDAFERLSPLPDGMHFTPSMSAKALFSNMKILEVPISYEERIGRSKLKPLTDGIRFLGTILAAICHYRPERLFILGCTFCLLGFTLLALYPTEYYFHHRYLEEWMIYRFLVCLLLGCTAFTLLSAVAISEKLGQLRAGFSMESSFWGGVMLHWFEGSKFYFLIIVLLVASGISVFPGMIEYLSSGHVTLHWSRVIVTAAGLLVVAQAVTTRLLIWIIELRRFQGTVPSTKEHASNESWTAKRRAAKH